jgi:3-deoxy-7-phosphoheptulonate synthase
MIILLSPGVSPETRASIEGVVRRAGGDPKRLRAASADGREAIAAQGADGASLRALLDGASGVESILGADVAYPKVAKLDAASPPTAVFVGSAARPVAFGPGAPVLIAGPCAVESAELLEQTATAVARAGARVLRGGAYKPRTSPYSFQGLGEGGLRLLREVADRHALAVVTEVLEPAAVAPVSEHADMLQVGSRNMQNFALLKAIGRQRRPVLLKRGMSATLEEWLLAAEYIADAGNAQIVLCERGLRHFDAAARNLLDLSAVPLLRERTRLPIVVDPSHGVGVRSAVAPMALAAVAAGADGVILECHPDPGIAKSDGYQALTPDELHALAGDLERLGAVVRELRTTRRRDG